MIAVLTFSLLLATRGWREKRRERKRALLAVSLSLSASLCQPRHCGRVAEAIPDCVEAAIGG